MGLDVEVCLIEIVAEFELPRTERSLCMVAPAGAVMGLGSRGWSGVLTTLHGALRELHARSGAAVAGWVWERPWRTFSPPHEHQLTLWLAAADAVELDVVAGLCSTAQEPWRCGGMAVRPPFALPALYIAKTGQAYHVWHAGRGGPFTPVLRRAGVRLVRERRRLADAFADQFLPGAHHALGVEERNQPTKMVQWLTTRYGEPELSTEPRMGIWRSPSAELILMVLPGTQVSLVQFVTSPGLAAFGGDE